MKVIFLQDVPRVGRRYDIKEINDGYAVNFLFPKKLALPATPKAVEEIEKRKKEIVIEKEIEDNLLARNLEEIKGKRVTIKAKADEKGHLFKAIHEKDIAEALKKESGIELGEKFIALAEKIKEIGEHEIPISIKNKKSFFKLIIERA